MLGDGSTVISGNAAFSSVGDDLLTRAKRFLTSEPIVVVKKNVSVGVVNVVYLRAIKLRDARDNL